MWEFCQNTLWWQTKRWTRWPTKWPTWWPTKKTSTSNLVRELINWAQTFLPSLHIFLAINGWDCPKKTVKPGQDSVDLGKFLYFQVFLDESGPDPEHNQWHAHMFMIVFSLDIPVELLWFYTSWKPCHKYLTQLVTLQLCDRSLEGETFVKDTQLKICSVDFLGG